MPATVTNPAHLAHYRNSHPPLLQLWQAQCRLTSAWFSLSMRLGMALIPRR